MPTAKQRTANWRFAHKVAYEAECSLGLLPSEEEKETARQLRIRATELYNMSVSGGKLLPVIRTRE
jgi:hypothetical protein